MTKKILLLLLIVSQAIFSQSRTCGMEQKMHELQFNPLLKNKYKEHLRLKELAENAAFNKNAQAPQATFFIPVAVHFPTGNNANRACLVALAQNQIAILNNDFRGTNSDISLWNNVSQYFPGVNTGSFDVQFVLATQNHPAGTDANLVNGQPCVTIGYNFGQGSDWDSNFAGYMNFVCKNLAGGVLGYAYLGSGPGNGAAVFIDNNAFGSTSSCTGFIPGAPYNKGRTLTHELGHYLNLYHIWENDDEYSCANDFVSDTPLHDTANEGCPPAGHTSLCAGNNVEMTMNYMDYTNDACMYMLTAGQVTRMNNHFNNIKNNFNQTKLSLQDITVKSFKIYPNPNEGNFTIDFKSLTENANIEIFDITGRKVFSKNIQDAVLNYEISLENTNAGLYLVQIKDNFGTQVEKILVR